jgi:hypothetical protein
MNTLVKRDFPGPEILDILVYRDVTSGEELFPTKDSVLACPKDKIQTLERQKRCTHASSSNCVSRSGKTSRGKCGG